MIEVEPMVFCDFIQKKRLKTSRKLSTLTGDHQEHIMVNRQGEILGKSTSVLNIQPNPFERTIKYFICQ